MLLAAANSAGGHSTVNALAAIAILIWIVAGAVALLGWARRCLRRWQPTRRLHNGFGVAWLRVGAAHRRIMAAAGAPDQGAGSTTGSRERPGVTLPRTSELRQASGGEGTAVVPAPAISPPAIPGPRYSPETLELLGRHLDNSRRLAVLEDRVAPILDRLPPDRWLVDRYVLLGGHRIPFLILGETGVFALWTLGGRPEWREIPMIAETADRVKLALPGYTGDVRAGVCRALAPDVKPRWWCRAGELGAWVMGLNWVIPWLEHFGPEHGLGAKDVERLRQMAGPHWGHPVTENPFSPLIPEIDETRLG